MKQSLSQYPDRLQLYVDSVDDNGNLHCQVVGVQMPDNAVNLVIPEWIAPYLLPISGIMGSQFTDMLSGRTVTLRKQ